MGAVVTRSITDPLPLEHLGKDWEHWRLMEDLAWRGFIVPAGFISDGASIPRPVWGLLPATGPYLAPALVHDMLIRAWVAGAPLPLARTRKACDDLFLEAMKDAGVGFFTRTIIYVAVRIGGDPKVKERIREADKRKARLWPEIFGEKYGVMGGPASPPGCSCHPDDRPAICMKRHATSECLQAYEDWLLGH